MQVPVQGSSTREIEGCCCSEGSVDIALELNKTGYVPGEPIVYDITIGNKSENKIESVNLLLVQVSHLYTFFRVPDHARSCVNRV